MISRLLTYHQDMKPMHQCTLYYFTILDLIAFLFLYSPITYLQLVVYKYD